MPPVVVIGAGIGGLATAVALAAQGRAVHVIERDSAPGGKLRPVHIGGHALDAGPTVMTMRDVFDGLFALAGERLDEHLRLTPLRTLARHTWPDGSCFDLHADRAATLDAIGRLSGAGAARQYAAFCTRSQSIYETLNAPYLRRSRPNPVSLAWRCAQGGLAQWLALARISPFQTLWRELGRQFSDPRLRQLFARYATYGGSSPLAAPATLMLIAHVEQAACTSWPRRWRSWRSAWVSPSAAGRRWNGCCCTRGARPACNWWARMAGRGNAWPPPAWCSMVTLRRWARACWATGCGARCPGGHRPAGRCRH
jgi:1-hydroxycarotenoid 3,4-desaturase